MYFKDLILDHKIEFSVICPKIYLSNFQGIQYQIDLCNTQVVDIEVKISKEKNLIDEALCLQMIILAFSNLIFEDKGLNKKLT